MLLIVLLGDLLDRMPGDAAVRAELKQFDMVDWSMAAYAMLEKITD